VLAPLVLAPAAASAVTLDFDALVSGTAASAATFPGVSVDDALVLSESDIDFLLGFDAVGKFATTGEQGLVNTLGAAITFEFDAPVRSFAVDVLGLPGLSGDPTTVVIQAFNGNVPVAIDIANLGLIGDSGFPEDTLSVFENSGFTRIVLFGAVPCAGVLCFELGPPTSLFADTVRFEAVPEPGTALLLGAGLAGLARLRRRARAALPGRRRARVRPAGGVAAVAACVLAIGGCVPRPTIVSPADASDQGSASEVNVQIALGAQLPAGGKLRVTLLAGVDAPPGKRIDLSSRVTLQGTQATALLSAADLVAGRNTLFAAVDANGDGRSENVASSTFRWSGGGLLGAACKRAITPRAGENHTVPVYMAGFDNDRKACTAGEQAPPEANCQFGPAHDDLWARGFVVASGETKIAVVTLDVIGYFYNEVQTIRSLIDPALGIDKVIVTSTHTHEGPDTMGLWGASEVESGVDLGYLDFVNDQVAACIQEANAALVPAELRLGTGNTRNTSLPPWPDLVQDGRVLQAMVIPKEFLSDATEDLVVQGDAGPVINPNVPSLQLRDRATGDVLVTAFNYASHPESLADDNRSLTSDFPNYARAAVEQRYGGVAMYVSADLGVLQGPLGVDVQDPVTGQPAPPRTFRKAEIIGGLLAERVIEGLEGNAWTPTAEVGFWSTGPIFVEVENPFFLFLGETLGVFGRRTLIRDANDVPFVESEANVLRIGDAQMVVTPNELDPQIGNLYRAQMTGADHKWLLGLGNDEIGYQMQAEKFVPGCFECGLFVFTDINQCPFYRDFYSQLPPQGRIGICDTIFQNNIGPKADTLLQGQIGGLLDQANP
ncbi:MAG TPA: PEP-CTERM sorting domain-containing protein, partial [Myxococcota bacterium]|nr:PEP-CTERM sorting domain-containing protein [Myxococcota bacterium]